MMNQKLLLTVVNLLLFFIFPAVVFSQTTQKVAFTFNLSSNANTSAGVFAKDGTLLKTLWSGVSYTAGSHTEYWDGTADDGNLLPDSSYDVRVLTNNVKYEWMGVVGNTSASSTGPTVHHALQRIYNMAFTGSTGYYATNYNEQFTALFKFNINNAQAKTGSILDKGAATDHVTTDGNYVYWNAADANNLSETFVYATRVSDDQEVSFAGGKSVGVIYSRTYASVIDEGTTSNSTITGLVVQKSGKYLFVAHKFSNELHVLDKSTGYLIQKISVSSPTELAVDANDNLWMVSGTTLSKYGVNTDGTLTGAQLTLPNLVAPLGVAVSPDNNTVVVTDGGNSQQLKGYSNSSGASLWTYGQAGGYATDPTVTNDKFYFADISKVPYTFISFVPDGTFWVGDPGNYRVMHFAANRSYIDNIMYIPGFYSGAADMNNPSRVFADFLEFSVDYTKPLSPTNGSWKLAKNWGYNADPAYIGDYHRLRSLTTLSNGRTYAFLRHDYKLALVELPPTGGLRLTGYETPDLNYRMYQDGSLKTVSQGNPATWITLPLTGFDGNNNPIWGASQVFANSPADNPIDPMPNAEQNIAITSSNVVTTFDPGNTRTGYHLGGIKAGDNKWLWKTAMATQKDYSGPFPTDGSFDIGNLVNNYAGSMALALDRSIIWGYHGEFWKNSQVNKWQHVYDDGLFVGQFGTTGPENTIEAPAMMAGNSFSAVIVKDAAGNGYLYHNDESYHGGFHQWKISGLSTIQEQTIPVVLFHPNHGLLGTYFNQADLNNFNTLVNRIDATVNNNASPAEVTNPLNSSTRWTGFVKSPSSQTYTFYTSGTKGMRLWIDGNLLVDKWSNNGSNEYSATITLEANKTYPVDFEISGGTAALSWSYAGQAKQIIPSTFLYPGPATDMSNGVNLMEGLHYSTVLENNMYGWARNPASEDYTNIYSKYWTVKTSVKTSDKAASPDVYIGYTQSSGDYSVTRDLGSNTGLTTWKLEGSISYEGNEGNADGNLGGSYLEVLDNAGKVISRFYMTNQWNPTDPVQTFYANTTVLAQNGTSIMRPLINKPQPFSISATNGTLIFSYAGFAPVTTSIFDASGNWAAPKTLRLFYYCNGANYGRSIDMQSMTFYNGIPITIPPANQPPVANAGTDITITLPTNSATLDGSASTDPDGTIASYAWTQVSGPSTGNLNNATNSKPSLTGLQAGTYVYQLTVTDNKGATATAQVKVIVNPAANQSPVANAGTDITITLPINTATLDGTGSNDPDGTIASYSWTQVSGPTTGNLSNATNSKPSLTGLQAGTYVYQLTVTDNKGATATAQVKVIVNAAANQSPVANAGTDITITLPTNTATLDGTSSNDPDGTIASYSWTQVSGPTTGNLSNATNSKPSLTGLQAGSYVYQLTVTDNKGATATAQVKVTVNPAANQPPVANAGTDISITLPTNTAALDGTGSNDPDGTIASYAWTQVSGPTTGNLSNATSSKPSLTGLQAGTYLYQLTVTDDKGATATAQVKVTVNPAANQPPVANAGTDITITLPTNTAALDGTGSNDPDGTIASYAWTQVSGPTTGNLSNATSSKPSLTGLQAGTYLYQLTVTDDKGATATAQVKVTVNPANNQLPVANAGTDITITLPTNSATLDGTGSNDPDGTIASYSWSQVSGPTTGNLSNATSSKPSLSGLQAGTYVYQLTVTDNKGATAAAQVKVTVNPANNQLPVANAGTDITITLPTNSATLDGTGSNDPDGTIASYAWTQVSGPTTGNLSNATSSKPSLTGLQAGNYIYQLTVTDNKGATATAQVKVTVNPANNQLPVANAGTDITITLPVNTTTLDGTGSNDPDGTIASYSWSQVSGPTTGNLSNATSSTPSLAGLQAGTYVYQLTVTDNKGATATAQVKVTVNPANNQLPVANAGTDINITLPTNSATLDGTASNDPDGTIASYSWTQVSGPTTGNLSNATSSKPSLTGLQAGTYIYQLTVTDNKGATATAQVKVTVNPANNQLPVANAGTDITITLPTNSATLDGTASNDPDGTIASYAWTQVSGPTTGNLSNATSSKPSLTGLQAGTYVYQLTVTDDKGAIATAQVKVTVNPANNQLPVANAGTDITITLPTNSATLDGTGSSDPDGTIASYAWTQVSGPTTGNLSNATSSKPSLTGLQAGTYVYQLTVTDDKGAIATAQVKVTVNPANNQLPIANAGTDISITLPTNSATLDGTGSNDPDGTIASYSWSQVSGPTTGNLSNATSSKPSLSGLQAGTYVYQLTVTDNKGATATAQVKVTVNPAANQPPVANAGTDITITLPTNSATLDGTGSNDPDGIIASYAWTQVSGPTTGNLSNATSSKPSLSSLQAGTYVYQLTVTDNKGATATAQVKVTVNPAANQPPVANAGTDITITLPTNTATLDGTGSSDPDGTIASYSWTQVSGPTTGNLSNATSSKPSLSGLQAGTYVYQLTVTDNKGATATAQVKVTVNPAANKAPIANAGKDTVITISMAAPGDINAVLNGSNSTDPDGTITNYLWKMVSGPVSATIDNSTNKLTGVTLDKIGKYVFELTVTDNNGASSKATVSVEVINTFRYDESFRLYPNPANGYIKVEYVVDLTGLVNISVYSLSGAKVLEEKVQKDQSSMLKTINLTSLASGNYILVLTRFDNRTLIKSFIKQ